MKTKQNFVYASLGHPISPVNIRQTLNELCDITKRSVLIALRDITIQSELRPHISHDWSLYLAFSASFRSLWWDICWFQKGVIKPEVSRIIPYFLIYIDLRGHVCAGVFQGTAVGTCVCVCLRASERVCVCAYACLCHRNAPYVWPFNSKNRVLKFPWNLNISHIYIFRGCVTWFDTWKIKYLTHRVHLCIEVLHEVVV